MGRAWRIEYEGALYHLMSRRNDGQYIYLNDADRNLFLETISKMSERFKVDIFASAKAFGKRYQCGGFIEKICKNRSN